MSKKEFDEFVLKQAGRRPPDAKKELEEWLRYLKDLYSTLYGFLKPYLDVGNITIASHEINMFEEQIGSYKADRWLIQIGDRTVKLIPVGTYLIGSKGRVDMQGRGGLVRIVLVDGKIPAPSVTVNVNVNGSVKSKFAPEISDPVVWTWKIATSPPHIQYLPLTEESFFTALLEVANV